MYAEKQQGIIYFKAKDEQKGLKIDLATGIVTSQTAVNLTNHSIVIICANCLSVNRYPKYSILHR